MIILHMWVTEHLLIRCNFSQIIIIIKNSKLMVNCGKSLKYENCRKLTTISENCRILTTISENSRILTTISENSRILTNISENSRIIIIVHFFRLILKIMKNFKKLWAIIKIYWIFMDIIENSRNNGKKSFKTCRHLKIIKKYLKF